MSFADDASECSTTLTKSLKKSKKLKISKIKDEACKNGSFSSKSSTFEGTTRKNEKSVSKCDKTSFCAEKPQKAKNGKFTQKSLHGKGSVLINAQLAVIEDLNEAYIDEQYGGAFVPIISGDQKCREENDEVGGEKVKTTLSKSVKIALQNAESDLLDGFKAKKAKRKMKTEKTSLPSDSPNSIASASAGEGDYVESDVPVVRGKKKRPWRQAIRHQAKKVRLNAERLFDATEKDENVQESCGEKNTFVADSSAVGEAKKCHLEVAAGLSKRQRHKIRLRLKKKALSAGAQEKSDENSSGKDVENEKASKDPKIRLEASYFRFINEKLYTTHSTEAVKLFDDDPTAFTAYHEGYKQQAKKWPAHPIKTLIKDLDSALPPNAQIADIGCGEAIISQKLGQKFKVYSFDLVALNEHVTVADMANLPLPKASVDVCVFCLSLMGTNLHQFLREAYRILKMNGKMHIAEVFSRFANTKHFISAVEKLGFSFIQKKELAQKYFVILTFQKAGKIENKRPMGLKLYPCLYKKRAGKHGGSAEKPKSSSDK